MGPRSPWTLTAMSGSTQPVAQTWRATEPRYPPHGISYPVQIARPHTVSKGCVCSPGSALGPSSFTKSPQGLAFLQWCPTRAHCVPQGEMGCHGRDHWRPELLVKSLSSHFKAGKMETGARLSWGLCLSESAVEFAYKHGAPTEYTFLAAQPLLDPFLLYQGGHC